MSLFNNLGDLGTEGNDPITLEALQDHLRTLHEQLQALFPEQEKAPFNPATEPDAAAALARIKNVTNFFELVSQLDARVRQQGQPPVLSPLDTDEEVENALVGRINNIGGDYRTGLNELFDVSGTTFSTTEKRHCDPALLQKLGLLNGNALTEQALQRACLRYCARQQEQLFLAQEAKPHQLFQRFETLESSVYPYRKAFFSGTPASTKNIPLQTLADFQASVDWALGTGPAPEVLTHVSDSETLAFTEDDRQWAARRLEAVARAVSRNPEQQATWVQTQLRQFDVAAMQARRATASNALVDFLNNLPNLDEGIAAGRIANLQRDAAIFNRYPFSDKDIWTEAFKTLPQAETNSKKQAYKNQYAAAQRKIQEHVDLWQAGQMLQAFAQSGDDAAQTDHAKNNLLPLEKALAILNRHVEHPTLVLIKTELFSGAGDAIANFNAQKEKASELTTQMREARLEERKGDPVPEEDRRQFTWLAAEVLSEADRNAGDEPFRVGFHVTPGTEEFEGSCVVQKEWTPGEWTLAKEFPQYVRAFDEQVDKVSVYQVQWDQENDALLRYSLEGDHVFTERFVPAVGSWVPQAMSNHVENIDKDQLTALANQASSDSLSAWEASCSEAAEKAAALAPLFAALYPALKRSSDLPAGTSDRVEALVALGLKGTPSAHMSAKAQKAFLKDTGLKPESPEYKPVLERYHQLLAAANALGNPAKAAPKSRADYSVNPRDAGRGHNFEPLTYRQQFFNAMAFHAAAYRAVNPLVLHLCTENAELTDSDRTTLAAMRDYPNASWGQALSTAMMVTVKQFYSDADPMPEAAQVLLETHAASPAFWSAIEANYAEKLAGISNDPQAVAIESVKVSKALSGCVNLGAQHTENPGQENETDWQTLAEQVLDAANGHFPESKEEKATLRKALSDVSKSPSLQFWNELRQAIERRDNEKRTARQCVELARQQLALLTEQAAQQIVELGGDPTGLLDIVGSSKQSGQQKKWAEVEFQRAFSGYDVRYLRNQGAQEGFVLYLTPSSAAQGFPSFTISAYRKAKGDHYSVSLQENGNSNELNQEAFRNALKGLHHAMVNIGKMDPSTIQLTLRVNKASHKEAVKALVEEIFGKETQIQKWVVIHPDKKKSTQKGMSPEEEEARQHHAFTQQQAQQQQSSQQQAQQQAAPAPGAGPRPSS